MGLERPCGSADGVSVKHCDTEQLVGVQDGSWRPARGLGLEEQRAKQARKRNILQLPEVIKEARNTRTGLDK